MLELNLTPKENETDMLKSAFGVKYWFCVDPCGTPLIFDYDDEPDRVEGRGWTGEFAMNNAISKDSVTKDLKNSITWESEPVMVAYSPLERVYYEYNPAIEEIRGRALFNKEGVNHDVRHHSKKI